MSLRGSQTRVWGRLKLMTAVLLAGTCTVLAQTTISTGTIQGTVSDPSGAVIPRAKVIIISQETGQVTHLTTTSAGLYTSGALAPGHYTVRVQAAGFKTAEQSLVVQVEVTSSANITLPVGATSETVQVVHDSDVRVNTEQATIEGVLTTEQIEDLPINGRNFIDLAQLEPGVQTMDVSNETTKIGHSGISVGGRYTESTRVEVDGLDMSDNTGSTLANISTSSIQEFSLEQSTMDLSSESTNSGAVNIVTRRGSNALHGEGLYLFRDRSLSADFNEGLHPPYQRHDFAGNLGGPILKDKLFFFVNGERYKQDLGAPHVVLPPLNIGSAVINQPLRQSLLTGRLDYTTPKGTLFYRFNYDNSKIVGSPPITEREFDNTPTHAIGYDFTSGPYTHSIRFGYVKNLELFQNAPQPGIYNPLPQVGVFINDFRSGVNTGVPAAEYQENKQIRYDGSRVFRSHIVRYGFSYTRLTTAYFQDSNGGGPSLSSAVTQETENFANNSCGAGIPCFPGGENNPLNYPLADGGGFAIGNGQGFLTEIPGFGLPAGSNPPDNRIQWYAGDSWKVRPNLTLSFGLHYIHDTGIVNSDMAPIPCSGINPSLEPAPPLPPIPCTGNLLDMFGPGLSARPQNPTKNFAPQVGIVWDMFKNGKTVLRVGGSKTYSTSTNAGIFDRVALLQVQAACPAGTILFPTAGGGQTAITRTPPTAAHPNGLDIATQVCNPNLTPGFTIGTVGGDVVALQNVYQAATVAAGPQSNPSFVGNTLTASGLDAPNYRTQYSYEMNAGVEHEIRNGVVISADYVRNVSLHYPMLIDVNHVGDSRYLNKNAALNAITATNTSFGCPAGIAGINCSIANGASIEDFAGNGLTSTTDFTGVAPYVAGLTPETAAAFAGINPNVGQGLFNFPIGRAVYHALQVSLRQQTQHPLPHTKNMYLHFSYTLSRYITPLEGFTGDDQDSRNLLGGQGGTIAGAKDYRNPLSHYGPTAFDRTHQFSLGTTIDFAKPLRVALIGHLFSPLSQSMIILDQGRSGEIYHTDFNGDGTTGDALPGTNPGAFMRSVKPGDVTSVIEHYNNTIAGTILPAGQALLNAGLLTHSQLIALGAVADHIPLGPNDPSPLTNRAGMTWLKDIDLRISAPIKLSEKVTLEPTAAGYNICNFANFFIDPLTRLSSALRGTPNTVNGTSNAPGQLNRFRASQGPSLFSLGTGRQFEFGMKVSF